MDTEFLGQLGRAIYLGLCVLAILRGDRPLRLAATVIVAAALVAPMAERLGAVGALHPGLLFIDTAALAGLACILLRDRRWWLVATTAFWLMHTVTPVAGLVGDPVSPTAATMARLWWAAAAVAATAVGATLNERARWDRGEARNERTVRALIAEYGEARARAELDRRSVLSAHATDRAEAARLQLALRRLTLARTRDGAF